MTVRRLWPLFGAGSTTRMPEVRLGRRSLMSSSSTGVSSCSRRTSRRVRPPTISVCCGCSADIRGAGGRSGSSRFCAHCTRCAEAEGAPAAALAEQPPTLLGIVVVEDMRVSGLPAASVVNANAWVVLDVSDVVRLAPVLGDDPEGIDCEAVAGGCYARPFCARAYRVQQCVAGRRDSESERELVERVERLSLQQLKASARNAQGLFSVRRNQSPCSGPLGARSGSSQRPRSSSTPATRHSHRSRARSST
jgi:hypothetical protein